jgi:phospholipid/cholesterol/gamma-HCH transport system ATP-binding protein
MNASPATDGSGDVARNIVEVSDLDYRVGEREIFNGLNLVAERGKITAILGPSGTGKTTLLRLLMGAIQPDRGTVRFFGRDVNALSRVELYAMRRRVGMLFQNGALLTDLDVFENVAFPLREHMRLPEPLLRRLVLMKLHAVGLRGAAELMPASLSGGMASNIGWSFGIAGASARPARGPPPPADLRVVSRSSIPSGMPQ